MNVCSLDVVTRAADFETVASTLELRGWEWAFLHDVDGEATLGDIARRCGIDIDSAIGFIHDAMHRGLVTIPTMTLDAYRVRVPMQPALRGSNPVLSLGTSAVAPAEHAFTEPAPASGAISFSSDAFDWNATEPSFEEPEDAADLAVAHDGVHYDERFGVEHAGGPFATTHQHDEEPASVDSPSPDEHVEPLAMPAHIEDAPFVPLAHDDDPFAITSHHDEIAHTPDPFATSAQAEDPFAVAPSENGHAFGNGTSLNGHTPVRFDDLFTDAAPLDAAAAAAHDEPVIENYAHSNGLSSNGHANVDHTAGVAEHATEHVTEHVAEHSEGAAQGAAETVDAPVQAHAVGAHSSDIEPEDVPHHDDAPGSISFSFSPDDPPIVGEPEESPSVRESPEVWTPPAAHVAQSVAPSPEPVVAQTQPAPAANAKPAADPRLGMTQSLYYERESGDSDAGRDLEAKVKNWKDSLSWREQQELKEARANGAEKNGVIDSLLRALGVR